MLGGVIAMDKRTTWGKDYFSRFLSGSFVDGALRSVGKRKRSQTFSHGHPGWLVRPPLNGFRDQNTTFPEGGSSAERRFCEPAGLNTAGRNMAGVNPR